MSLRIVGALALDRLQAFRQLLRLAPLLIGSSQFPGLLHGVNQADLACREIESQRHQSEDYGCPREDAASVHHDATGETT